MEKTPFERMGDRDWVKFALWAFRRPGMPDLHETLAAYWEFVGSYDTSAATPETQTLASLEARQEMKRDWDKLTAGGFSFPVQYVDANS